MASQDSNNGNGRNLPAVQRVPGGAQLAQAQEIPPELVKLREVRPDLAERAYTIMASRVVDQYNPPLHPARAAAAALYEDQTGLVCGRDFYVDNRMGIVVGYRGLQSEAAHRGARDYMDDYRSFSPAEIEDHEIKTGDTAVICELTIPAKARACREAGIPYRPTVGYGIVKASEKKKNDGSPIQLSGGYTWNRKARNRALKDALRHAGYASTAAEIIEDAEREGLDPAGAFGLSEQVKAGLRIDEAEYVVEHARRAAAAPERTPEELRAALNRNVADLRRPADFKGYGDEDEPTPPPHPDVEFDAIPGHADDGEQDYVGEVLASLAGFAAQNTGAATEKARNYALGCLKTLMGSDDTTKATFLRAAFGLDDPNAMTAGQASAIINFVKPQKVEDQWLPDPEAVKFLGLFRKHVMGQGSLFEE